jgi:hypothetical protein
METTIRRHYDRKQKNRGDIHLNAYIYIFMAISQGNSLCSYLQIKLSFFFTKIENRRAEHVLFEGLVPVGGTRIWERIFESVYSEIIVYIWYKWKK